MKKIFIIAGEMSGDSHGARLVRELNRLDPNLEFCGLGGNKMKEAGVQISTDLTRISVLGLTDVLQKYFTFRKIFYAALRQIDELKPDLIILIDYPGFNLRLAKKLKRKFPVVYYISPQIWAWGHRRIKVIKKCIDKLIVFFPFEKELYDAANIPCAFVGHPLADEIVAPKEQHSISDSRPVIGLLPGSRESEVNRILPTLLEAANEIQKNHSTCSFILSESNNIKESVYENILKPFDTKLNLKTVRGKPYEAIQNSDILIVTSGTATLETALHGKPFILVYKAARLTYLLGRMLIRIPFLGIVNILGKRKIVPELIQTNLTVKNLVKEIEDLINNAQLRRAQFESFLEIRRGLSTGNSVGLTALEILRFIQSSNSHRFFEKNLSD